MRRGIFGAIVLATLLVTGASAAGGDQGFVAEIEGKQQRSEGTPTGCQDGAQACGSGPIEGYGQAEYRFYVDSFAPSSDSCGDYVGTVTFTLGDGSRLTLDEQGTVCGPGRSFYATPRHSWGNPSHAQGRWQVRNGTGRFEGLSGDGTDELHSAGARTRAKYLGAVSS